MKDDVVLYLAADHRGFHLKEALKPFLSSLERTYADVGATDFDDTDDYVDYAMAGATTIAEDPEHRAGIFICGSGHGMDTVADKFKGIRADLCLSRDSAVQSREHGNTNVLVLAADDTDEATAKEIVTAWLSTPFSNEERHVRRLGKISTLESQNFK